MRQGYPIAVISTVNCDDVTMYHLLVGISAKVYTFSLIPTGKWYMVTPSHFTVYAMVYTLYHLSVGISARVYTFSLVPTYKWYMVTPSQLTVLITAIEYTFAVYTSCIWEGGIKNPQLFDIIRVIFIIIVKI